MEQQKTFHEFITKYSFVIPNYQRAYSWGEKQLNPFINDILEHCDNNDDSSDDTTYYLGHYILENSNNSDKFEIVDGQQRISTIYLFLLVCGYLKEKNYINGIDFYPVSYDKLGLEEIKAILNTRKNVDTELEKLLENSKTSSLKRMIEAVRLFKAAFSTSKKNDSVLNVDEIDDYIQIINKAYCSVAIFNDKSVASQIFELHNTRGVKLTETEKVKALLMKNIYIHSSTPIEAEKNIQEIQENFARIFELEEKASEVWLRGDMPLDTILMHHLRAVEDGNKIENFGSPQWFEGDRGSFEYVKESLSIKNKEEIVVYAKRIAEEFARSMEIITVDIPNADKKDNNHLIGDVLLLDKNKSLIFLLRAFRSDNSINYNLIKRWENFVLCYDIIYWNGFFYRAQYRDSFGAIYASLKPNSGFNDCNDLLLEFYKGKWFGSGWGHLGENAKKRFEEGKNKWLSNTYGWTRAGYFLYKYEIKKGTREDVEKIRTDIFKDDKVSIDHIVARGLTKESLGYADYENLNENDERKKEANELWKEIWGVINGIGNLALSTASNNSSDSNGLPNEHIETYKKCGFIETAKQVETWKNPEQFVSRINERSEDIMGFIYESIVNRNDLWE
ncbi:DUF262 domain-containing protein [Flavobacterium nackdongense]|jgi:hypothetical protein|uniref:DUF262 domain-containing protein n=1 Tax=Flavobacterium nackdongense TaxID=2547394 RepID=A0A4P6YBI3_9FLAO|nr:DUF262 domain-containing protein [Flavobacterium nackdongense]QBN20541.1 DUF262 domain-containing protein [Flavobacterium nackdongense]